MLSFKQRKDKRLARMSTDFKLHSSENVTGGSGFYGESSKNLIEKKGMEESQSDSISQVSEEEEVEEGRKEMKTKIRPFEIESSMEEESKESKESKEDEGGENEGEDPPENGFKLLEFNKRVSSPERSYGSPRRSGTDFEDNKKEDKKTMTLKEISMLLTRRKLEGYLSSSDSNIFPLTKHRKSKYLDTKDFIEITIRYCLMDDDGILNFINFLFVDDFIDLKCVNIYPLKVYKLLLYYEKIALFESLYEKEKEHDKAYGSNIITESFSYSIIINNITVALYLLKKYVKELYYKNESIIDSIIFILKEFSESNGAVRYHHGISHLEELLYFIEIFYKGFTYGQAYQLMGVLIMISKLEDGSEEFGGHFNSYTRQRIVTSIRTNKLRTHFLVYNYNPLKIVTAMVIIVKKLTKRFPTLKVSEESILKNYFKFCNEVMINYKDIDQVRDLLHDRMYNGKLVIDEMADFEMYQMFYYRKPLVICLEMWSGRYEMQSFLSCSTSYQSIMNIFFKKKSFTGFYTKMGKEMKDIMSCYGSCGDKSMKMHPKKRKAHLFMFKSWQKSMNLRYYIDALFILAISIALQLYIIDFSTTATSYYEINDEFHAKRDAANDTSLSASARAQAQTEFETIENKYLEINNTAHDKLVVLYYIWIVLTAYWFRNFFQIVYAKLRNKNYSVITGEFILSTIHLFLVALAVFRYYAFHIHEDPSDARYYKFRVIYRAYEEDFLNMTEITGLYMGIQWCRIIFLFKVNPTLGPMLNILKRMLQAISKFLIIYGLFLLIYVSGGRLLYTNQEAFASDTEAIVTLFSASLGSFSFNMWNSDVNISEKYNYAYLISYLIISNVILLNFIIAILTTIYDEVKNLSAFIYLVEIVRTRAVFGHNEYYSSLISPFIPLNIFLMPAYPFVIFCKSKKFNLILSHICYFPVAIIGTVSFFTISLVLVPFAYIALVYQNLALCLQKGIQRFERCSYLYWLLIIIIKEPFVLFILTFTNTAKFVKSLYESNLKINEENSFNKLTDLRDLNKSSFNMFRKKLMLYKNTLVDTKKLIRDLREEFDVSEHLKKIIYSSYEENNTKKIISEKTHDSNENLSREFKLQDSKGIKLSECSSFYIIRQFNLLKKFIVNNSIPYETPAAKKVPEGYHDNLWNTQNNKSTPEDFSDDEYNLNALEKFKTNKIKKRRVIDASKIMKILRECEEQAQFSFILNCKGVITMDHMKPKIPVEVCDEFNKDRVVECDFDKLRCKMCEKKDPKIHMMNINKNYSSLENAC